MHKLQRVSKIMKVLFSSLLCLYPLALILFWLNPQTMHYYLNGFQLSFLPYGLEMPQTLSVATIIYAFLLCLLPTTVKLCIFYFASKLFSLFEQGIIFSLRNVLLIRNIAMTMLIGELFVNPIFKALISMLLSWQKGPGERVLQITITGHDFGTIFISIIMFIASWVMAQGCSIKREQELTI